MVVGPGRWAGLRRVAPGFDPTCITNAAGAPSFAHSAKGGYDERLQLRSYAARSRNEIFLRCPRRPSIWPPDPFTFSSIRSSHLIRFTLALSPGL
jgi:hypothetical protein